MNPVWGTFNRVMKKLKYLILIPLAALATAIPSHAADMPQTERTRGLLKELLTKIDSADTYAARKEKSIDGVKSRLPGNSAAERYGLYFALAEEYSNYVVDSALVYIKKAVQVADDAGIDSLRFRAGINWVVYMAEAGLYTEALETLETIPREAMEGRSLVAYYNAWTLLYHNLYSGPYEPADFREKYRERYNTYRDSLLMVADPMSPSYLKNLEKKEARVGNIAEARRLNALRLSRIRDHRSPAYATCVYDRFAIAYLYEHNLTGEAMDDLLESAIIEVENSNKNIASLLRVEALLIQFNEVKAAKKVSDYYFSSLRSFGSRKRLIDGVEYTMKINDRSLQLLRHRYRQIQITLSLILVLMGILVFLLLGINSSRRKIARLRDNLQQSGRITKGYVGVVFQLYSSYIKRLDQFRTKVHANLKKGNVDQALELTMPSGDVTAEERKELFHNFDTAFMDIFPDYIQTVNSCLKPEARIVPKKTEILNTELRILALIKLGIEDSTEIAEMLHCSVKTVYNLRSGMKARLSIPEEEFKSIISAL